MPENTPTTQDFWTGQLRSGLVTLLIAGLTGFGTSWWRTQRDQDLCLYRLDAIEKKVNDLASQVVQNSNARQQDAITNAQQEMVLKNLLEQMADMKHEAEKRK
jgi:hypothetical protein